MRLTILCDNRVFQRRPRGLLAEWGFSAVVEINGDLILFDTGSRLAVCNNLSLLKIKNYKINTIVLSHGHYDHTGGLRNVLRLLDSPTLYAHPAVWSVRYHQGRYIGIPWKREEIESMAEIIEHVEPIKIAGNVWALGEIPRTYEDVKVKDSYIIVNGKKIPDSIIDDQGLAIKTQQGIVLLLGCCHAGLLNTIKHAESIVGDEVRYIIGGLHLLAMSEDRIREIAKWLAVNDIKVMTCHCTGFKAELILSSSLSNNFNAVGVGDCIEIN